MGNAWYCKKCEEGKIALSNSCAQRLINEETGIKYTAEEQWREKLHCLDDVHTEQKCLTLEQINKFIDDLETKIQIREVICPNRKELIMCLKENPDCIIRCMKEMDDFIDCIDTIRINIMKEKVQQSKKAAFKEEVKQIFNN